MVPHCLVGRYVNVTLWNDLADLLPGGPVGLVMKTAGLGDDIELTVQLLGFRMTFQFLLKDVELLPSEYAEAPLFTTTDPAEQGETIDLYMGFEAANFAADGGRPVYRVGVRLSRDSHWLLPLGTFLSDFDAAWRTSVEPDVTGSLTAQGPIPKWLFVR